MTTRIDAEVLIPGRGAPIANGSVVFDGEAIRFAGPASVCRVARAPHGEQVLRASTSSGWTAPTGLGEGRRVQARVALEAMNAELRPGEAILADIWANHEVAKNQMTLGAIAVTNQRIRYVGSIATVLADRSFPLETVTSIEMSGTRLFAKLHIHAAGSSARSAYGPASASLAGFRSPTWRVSNSRLRQRPLSSRPSRRPRPPSNPRRAGTTIRRGWPRSAGGTAPGGRSMRGAGRGLTNLEDCAFVLTRATRRCG